MEIQGRTGTDVLKMFCSIVSLMVVSNLACLKRWYSGMVSFQTRDVETIQGLNGSVY